MKTMKQFIIATTFVVGAMILFQGCVPEEGWALPGSPINFKATSGQGKSLKTKTVFSGDRFEVDNVPMERIDWLTGDKIRIWSDKATYHYDSNLHYADYRVTGVTTHQTSGENDNISIATINPDGIGGPEHGSGNGLEWSTGEHEFYSIYPSPYEREDAGVALLEHPNKFKLTFPATQTYTQDGTTLKPNMDYAYMYAAVKTAVASEVNLVFKPMFSAFQMTIDSEHDETLTLNSFTLSSETKALSGDLTATLSAADGSVEYTFPTASSSNKSVSVSFGEAGVTITKGSPMTFTVFVLPQDYNDLKVSFETSAGPKALELKQTVGSVESGIPFAAGLKYNINLGGMPGAMIHTLEVVNKKDQSDVNQITFTKNDMAFGSTKEIIVRSYRTSRQASAQKYPVSWKVLASNDDGETWVDHDSDSWPEWLVLSEYEGEGGIANNSYQTITVSINPKPDQLEIHENGNAGAMAYLQAAPEVGTMTAPRDLSLYDIYGNLYVNGANAVSSITKAGSHTANCYVLNQPGWFCIPLVYGNAIDQTRGDAGVYRSAFNKYVNADNNTITSPYILNDMHINASDCDAVVLWQDQVSAGSIIREDVEVIDAPSSAGLSCPYIRFHIAQANILPGNAVIALRDSNKRIIWSWHIWVTPTPHSGIGDSFSIQNLKYRTEASTSTETLSSIEILNSNLGWTAPMSFNLHSEDETLIKFVQTSGIQPLEKEASVDYEAGTIFESIFASGTYYQWGRKDPFLPSNGNSPVNNVETATNRAFNSPAGYTIAGSDIIKGVNSANMGNEPFRWIQHPYRMEGASDWLVDDERGDLWNSANDGTESAGGLSDTEGLVFNKEITQRPVKKTIYDPCPAGFCVPIGSAFSGFTTRGQQTNDHSYQCGDKIAANTTTGAPAGFIFSNNASKNSTTYTIFMPAAGQRGRGGLLGNYATNKVGYYWMSVPAYNNSGYGNYSTFIESYVTNSYSDSNKPKIFPMSGGENGSARTIRPMLEQDKTGILDGSITTGSGQQVINIEY